MRGILLHVITTTVFVVAVASASSAKELLPLSSKQSQVSIDTGAQLFKNQCQTCHSTGSSGGCLGPILAGEAARRSRDFIESRISADPQQVARFQSQYGHAELLPHTRVPAKDTQNLVDYIMSLKTPEAGFRVAGHSSPKGEKQSVAAGGTGTEAKGKALVYEKGCMMCHSFGGIGGQFGPAFDGIGSRRTPEYIGGRINRAELLIGTSAEYGERGIVMAPSQLSPKDIEDVVAYLSSLK